MTDTTITETRYMKVIFNNGTERNFAFKPISQGLSHDEVLRRIERLMKQPMLQLHLSDRFLLFPWQNIQCIEVAPTAEGDPVYLESIEVLHEFD